MQAGLADALAWTVPRKALQDQGERNFQDPFFRDMFKHSLQIRSSTNEPDPCRGLDGFATTYQAIGIDHQQTVLTDFRRKKYILTLDEFHHLEYEGVWQKAIDPIVRQAEFLLLMTGTLERGNGKQISYVPYTKIGNMLQPDLHAGGDTAVIEYTRQDALLDRSIIPLKFKFHDGQATWKDDMMNEISVSSISKANEKLARAALYTALSTEYSIELLTIAMDHWTEYRRFNRRSKLLVVTANIKHAKKAVAFLKKMNFGAEIATSHDSIKAAAAIKRFKYSDTHNILVTVAMAYEGLDVPPLTHIACLTHIRSVPWIIQLVARSGRVDYQSMLKYEQQFGYIFAPDDPLFRKIVNQLRAEQLPIIRKYKPPEQADLFESNDSNDDEVTEKNMYNIIPIGSSLTGKRGLTLAHDNGEKPLLTPSTAHIKTPKEIEIGLKKEIESHLSRHCFNNRYNYHQRNAEVVAYFNKRRSDMTIAELGNCLSYVQRNYPAGKVRGTNRPRVSMEVRPYINQES